MTTFSAIPSGDVDPDSPLTTGLVIKLRDNHLAQAEGAVGAPDILGLDFLTEITLSNDATAEFTAKIDSTYDEYTFIFNDVVPVSDNVFLYSQFSVDGGSNYITTATYRILGNLHNQARLTSNQGVGSASGEGLSGISILYNPAGTTQRKRFQFAIMITEASGGQSLVDAGYENIGLAAINAIKFYFSGGNLESGTIRMYGRRIQ